MSYINLRALYTKQGVDKKILCQMNDHRQQIALAVFITVYITYQLFSTSVVCILSLR